ncbi:putative leucine-rich repeat-containing protein DDB_G0290503 isoform X2 [Ranitomeya imitator]
MGILGTDYALRSGQVIFLILVTSAVILGFSYLNEMYQRIQLQEEMERQTQHLIAERSVAQRKASLLQAQIENSNKEMKRLQDTHAFQSEQQNSICEKERNDLLDTISSNEDTITNVQTEYESLKQRFEYLRSVLEQFENNQSRLLEKFSTQSTQCMNVISMLSKLCSKRNGNVIEKIAQVTKQNETFSKRATTQSSTSVNATVSSLLGSTPQYFYKTEGKQSIEVSSKRPPIKDTDSDNAKLGTLKAMQKLQEMFLKLKDNEDGIMNLENTQYLTENMSKSISEEKDQHKSVTIKETQSTTAELSTEREPKRSENRSELKASESVNLNQTKINKVDAQKPMLPPKNKNLLLTNQNKMEDTEDKAIFAKEDLTDTSKELIKIGENNKKSEGKVILREMVEAQNKPQKLIQEKIKTPEGYKENEELKYKNNIENLETDLELNDDEIPEIIF